MAKFVWVVRALSPRDGGWVRWFGHFRSETDAWLLIEMFWEMMVRAADYTTLKVVKTISFQGCRVGPQPSDDEDDAHTDTDCPLSGSRSSQG